jgi:hypothetical protein
MDGFWKQHGNTTAALAMVAFCLFMAAAIGLETDDTTSGRTTGAVVFGLCTVALLVGLWLIREGRATPVAHALIVLAALVPGVSLFWILLIPTVLAFIIIYFGVIRGGLAREIGPSADRPRLDPDSGGAP